MANLRLWFFCGLSILCGAASAQEVRDFAVPLRDWSAPATFTADRAGDRAALSPEETQATVPSSPVPFIGIKPCRIADTRSAAFPSGYGPPIMAANVSRDFVLAGRCGIPEAAQAVSLNITVTGTQGTGYILIYPKGGNAPGVSTLNFVAGQTIANAAVVPLGDDGGVTVVAVVAGTHLLIDTNGFYAGSASGTQNTFVGDRAGNFTTTGFSNTGVGVQALQNVTSGGNNTAVGLEALFFNTTGSNNNAFGVGSLQSNTGGQGNVAVGSYSLLFNTTGGDNTGLGTQVLSNNTTGNFNSALGYNALNFNQTGSNNTALGRSSLFGNVDGEYNTAVGYLALLGNVSGSSNTAVGERALQSATQGGNTAVGFAAGSQLQTGIYNIYIGDAGVATESNTTRIGHPGISTAAFLSGVRGAATGVADAIPVVIDSAGQLGTISSSVRFKEQIEDMGEASEGLLKLRPVTFRWRGKADAPRQFGLIAEEVEKVVPELVVHAKDGQAETVLYSELPAMLVNELQKQERRIEEQASEIRELQSRLAKLEERAGSQ
jgi:hypothetical protein